jgi:hypothetical protein
VVADAPESRIAPRTKRASDAVPAALLGPAMHVVVVDLQALALPAADGAGSALRGQ